MSHTMDALDPYRYRHLLALRDEALRLLAAARAEMGPRPSLEDRRALERIKRTAASFDRRVSQLSRTLSDHPLPTHLSRPPHP